MTRPATSGAREGGEKEEPKEPPLSSELAMEIVDEPGGYIRIIGGAFLLSKIESYVKEPFYRYNGQISSYGYYVKPVHKVYKYKGGSRLIYVYYGRYWFRKQGSRLIYAGTVKPRDVPVEPPRSPLEDITLILDGEDLLVNSDRFEDFYKFAKQVIPGLSLSYRRR